MQSNFNKNYLHFKWQQLPKSSVLNMNQSTANVGHIMWTSMSLWPLIQWQEHASALTLNLWLCFHYLVITEREKTRTTWVVNTSCFGPCPSNYNSKIIVKSTDTPDLTGVCLEHRASTYWGIAGTVGACIWVIRCIQAVMQEKKTKIKQLWYIPILNGWLHILFAISNHGNLKCYHLKSFVSWFASSSNLVVYQQPTLINHKP